ncbi:hypothetical protein ACOJIV_18135 [Haloarcula sp. AONF1]
MTEYSDMPVYFHRLAPGCPSEDVLYDFYQDGLIICHYENEASFSDEDYDDSTDIEEIVQLANSGGICLIQLDAGNDYYDRGRKLGVVIPETEPFILGVRSDGTRTKRYADREEAQNVLENNDEVEYIYKVLQLQENIRELGPGEFLLSSYEPPHTTLTQWSVVEDQIRSILSDTPLPTDEPTSYSPDQTERLCEEYLREEYEYYPLIQPGGRGGVNQSFDLIGGINNDRAFGEVKNIKGTSDSALNDLEAEAGSGKRAFYFSRNPVDQDVDDVEVILLEEVINKLFEIDRTKQMMKEMTGR